MNEQNNNEVKLHALDYWQVIRNRYGVILLAFFLVFNVFIGAAVVAKLKFQHVHFFPSLDLIFVNGASNSLGTFVLFWTLFYNICHLF